MILVVAIAVAAAFYNHLEISMAERFGVSGLSFIM
jgi:hypothetical protein